MEAVWSARWLLLEGFGVTVAVALLSLGLATVFGALGAAAKLGGGPVGRRIAEIYTTLIRGVPDLVLLLLLFFYGERMLNAAVGALGGGRIDLSPFAAGVIVLGFIYGAYMTEAFRGAWRSMPPGQMEAAVALGLSRRRALWRIAAPQVARHALPGFSNVWQVLAKATAVISVVGVTDVVTNALRVGRRERELFTFLLVVMVAYLVITAVSGWALKRAERRLAVGS